MKVHESDLKKTPNQPLPWLSPPLWTSYIWSKKNESALAAEGKEKQPLSMTWWQECRLGLFCSWICSGCRCWVKAGPLRWPASCARQSTCKWSILAPCWMVRIPTLCVNAGRQAAAGCDDYPTVSWQAAVQKSLMPGCGVLLLYSRLLNARARKGPRRPGSCAPKHTKGYKRWQSSLCCVWHPGTQLWHLAQCWSNILGAIV